MILLLKNLLFTVAVPGTVAVFIPIAIVSHDPMVFATSALIGFALLAIGGAIYTWCIWDFATAGHGTPAPIDPPTTLVIRGLYQYTRNPMYLGVISVIAGWAVLFQSYNLLFYAVCVTSVFYLFVLIYEEPYLRRNFGADYEKYCSKVGRWLPSFRR